MLTCAKFELVSAKWASGPCYCQRVGVKNGLQSLALTEWWIGFVDKRLLNALRLTTVKLKFRNRIGTAFRFVHVTCSTFLSAWSPSAHPLLQRQVQAMGSELTPAQGLFYFLPQSKWRTWQAIFVSIKNRNGVLKAVSGAHPLLQNDFADCRNQVGSCCIGIKGSFLAHRKNRGGQILWTATGSEGARKVQPRLCTVSHLLSCSID